MSRPVIEVELLEAVQKAALSLDFGNDELLRRIARWGKSWDLASAGEIVRKLEPNGSSQNAKWLAANLPALQAAVNATPPPPILVLINKSGRIP